MNGPTVSTRTVRRTKAAARLFADQPVRAAGFIVTVYGDVVVPRGGVLWMGTLIDICAAFGLSETLVRTAVSRLVSAGRLAGERAGRRSYYRLTPAAHSEFAAVSALLFDPPAPPDGWLFLRPGPTEDAEALYRAGWAEIGHGLWLASDMPGRRPVQGLLFAAGVEKGPEALRALARDHWDLAELAGAYRQFIGRFAPLEASLDEGVLPQGRDSLTARLALVHHYRGVVLRDPHLPVAAWPALWPEPEARQLFARLYTRLSAAADSYVGSAFQDGTGPLACETATTRQRMESLGRMAMA